MINITITNWVLIPIALYLVVISFCKIEKLTEVIFNYREKRKIRIIEDVQEMLAREAHKQAQINAEQVSINNAMGSANYRTGEDIRYLYEQLNKILKPQKKKEDIF